MSDPFDEVMPGRRGAGGSERLNEPARPPAPSDEADVSTGVLRMEFSSDIYPSLVNDLWNMQNKLNDAATNGRVASDDVEVIAEDHGFYARLLHRSKGDQTRVWELGRSKPVAFLYESDIYDEPFVIFPRADGVRFV